MNSAVFLDRDGTLNDDPGYVHKIEHFRLLPGVIDGLRLFKGFKLIIITNQSGIGRGIFSEGDFHKFNSHLVAQLAKEGIKVEGTYFCKHHPDDICDCRKPSAKMIMEAAKKFDIGLAGSWVIGDHPHDIKMGKAAGCKSIYLLSGHGRKHKAELGSVQPDLIAEDFFEAAEFIIKHKRGFRERMNSKIVARGELKQLAEKLKSENKRIVTCNGCFDILHAGHIKFLSEAKAQGDILIVGLNSDKSVKGNKGPSRPINNENDRAVVMSALGCVDYVTIFDESNPIKLLSIIRPDVHCNGEEYGEDCIEAEVVRKNGGKIYLIKPVKGFSTTNIINKARGEGKP